jgi:hypothetical protein
MRLLDEDPVLGIKRFFHWNGDGTFTIETRQDVGGIVEANKRQFNDAEKRFGKGDFHHVGRIPLSLTVDYFRDGDESEIRKFLNLSDNSAWKTKPVKL